MMRLITNLFKSLLCVAIAGLVGYYNFGVNGVLGLITNSVFFALGMLLILSWKSPKKSKCEHNLEKMSLNETNITADVAASEEMIDKKLDQNLQ